MWEIGSATCPNGGSGVIYGGLGTNMGTCSLNQDLLVGGAMYVVQFEGHGSITLTATNAPAVGDIGTLIVNNNSALTISYVAGSCTLTLSVDDDNNAVISGASPSIITPTLFSMLDMDVLVPYLTLMVMQSPALQTQWQNDVMTLLETMGFPESAMSNLDTDCITQYISALQAVTFPSTQPSPHELHLFLKAHATKDYSVLDGIRLDFQSWKCTWCKIGVLAAVTVLVAIALVAVAVSAPASAIATMLGATAATATAAASFGVSVTTVASVIAAAVTATGILSTIFGEVTEGLCVAMKACKSS